nr:MAG TPA: hypothetical protein [Caudoviricetes sp.]
MKLLVAYVRTPSLPRRNCQYLPEKQIFSLSMAECCIMNRRFFLCRYEYASKPF